MSIPRIVAVDLDGTLLRSDHTVSDRSRAALALAERHGTRVVAVTARPPRILDEIADQAGLTGVAICSNGAMRYDLSTGDITIVHPSPATSPQQPRPRSSPRSRTPRSRWRPATK